MSLPVEVNPLLASSVPDTSYKIDRSLRIRSSGTAYLSRTFGNGNRKTWTWSGWVKRGALGATSPLMGCNISSYALHYFYFNSDDTLTMYFESDSGSYKTGWYTTAKFRDTSAWYHVVCAFDTTQAAVADRCKFYVNGILQTINTLSYNQSYLPQNKDCWINTSGYTNYIGSGLGVYGYYFDGYMAEVNFIDGQALAPTSFGEIGPYGVWRPKAYTGTYGTTGFYLNFKNNASTTTLGYDTSGNGNNWTTNNISLTAGVTYDSMTDVPTLTSATAANYCVLNPLKNGGGGLVTAGNLRYAAGTVGNQAVFGSMAITSGKYYFEAYMNQGSPTGNAIVGLFNAAGILDTSWYNAVDGWALDNNANGNWYKRNNGAYTSLGSRTTTALAMVAVDKDANKIWFGADGVWFDSGDPANGLNPAYSNLSSAAAVTPAAEVYANQGSNDFLQMNFGQRPFSYTAPSGFKSLNTYNLPTPAIPNGAAYMGITTYAGNGTAQNITNGTFKPDMVWVKSRSLATSSNYLYDSIRGVLNSLTSNDTSAEQSVAQTLTSFNSNGFTLGTAGGALNGNGSTFIGWQWQAGQGSTSTNTNGSITSTVSVNATAGFSVVTYTGTGANATVGHGLGVAPSMIIVKSRTSVIDWVVYHTSVGATGYLILNLTAAAATSSFPWNNTAPTSSVFSIGTAGGTGASATNYVAYCWSAVPGYSAFGSYTGNGSSDGVFIYTGFRPRFFMWKRTDTTANWDIMDTSRDTYNLTGKQLFPNLSDAEFAGGVGDMLSNGFKFRDGSPGNNASGGTYIYAAFAENPFKYSLAR